MVELLIDFAIDGAMDRIDQRNKPARELRLWGLHPSAPCGARESACADNDSFEAGAGR